MYKINKEKSKVEIELTVDSVEWEQGVQKVYEETKGRYSVVGFRKGHAPRKVIEKQYGEGVFFEDTVNYFAQKTLDEVYSKELDLEPVSAPTTQFESYTKEAGLKMKIMFEIMPDFTLGQYKDLTIKVPRHEVNDHDVEHQIKHFLEHHAKFEAVERQAKLGDSVVIDFVGYMDDVAFEGGEGKDYPLELGSHTFIDGFEDQLVGTKKGDKVGVNVTFPENYGHAEYAGKPAVFEVEVKEVREKILPELNDKFISDTTEFETVEEYKKDVLAHIQSMQTENEEKELEYQLNKAVIDGTEMEIPDSMIQANIDGTVRNMNETLAMYGMKLEDYLAQTGTTFEGYIASLKERTINGIKIRHIYKRIIEENNLDLTAEEIEESIKGLTDENEIARKQNDMLIGKIMKFLKENNKIEYVNE